MQTDPFPHTSHAVYWFHLVVLRHMNVWRKQIWFLNGWASLNWLSWGSLPSNNARWVEKKDEKRNIQSLVWLKSSIFVTLYSAYEAYERKRERTKDDIALNPAIIRICVFFMIFFVVFFKEQDNGSNSAIFLEYLTVVCCACLYVPWMCHSGLSCFFESEKNLLYCNIPVKLCCGV